MADRSSWPWSHADSKSRPITLQLEPPSEGRSSRHASPQRLPTELMLKAQTQMSRLYYIKDLANFVPDDPLTISLEELNAILAQLEDIHNLFTKEHTYFEVTWPSTHLDHEYFAKNMHSQETAAYGATKRVLSRLKHAVSSLSLTVASIPADDTVHRTKLPEISLPKFRGDYVEWPTFRDLFSSLILESPRLNKVEQLYYLRGQLEGQPAQLIAGLPLTGASLAPAWEMLTQRYENRRLIIQSNLDQFFNNSSTTQRKAASLEKMISTFRDVTRALETIGATSKMWNNVLVYQASRLLDRITREQWETSLGTAQDYSSFAEFESFISSQARALERCETASVASASSPARVPSRRSLKATTPASTSTSTTYPCDCCGGQHFVVTCNKFRDMSASERGKFVLDGRLCFNCLGRHNVRSCRTSKGCKKCPGRHHTMLHDTQKAASSAQQEKPSTSQAPH